MELQTGNSPTKYYIKNLDRTKGTVGAYDAPNWCIYKRLEHGSIAVCLCYDEPTARELMRLLEEAAEPKAQGQDDMQA